MFSLTKFVNYIYIYIYIYMFFLFFSHAMFKYGFLIWQLWYCCSPSPKAAKVRRVQSERDVGRQEGAPKPQSNALESKRSVSVWIELRWSSVFTPLTLVCDLHPLVHLARRLRLAR